VANIKTTISGKLSHRGEKEKGKLVFNERFGHFFIRKKYKMADMC
jgi:hypothetical protein